MKTGKQNILFILFVFVLQACSQDNQSFDSFKNKFDADFKSELKDNHVSHASFAFINRDSVVYEGRFSLNGDTADSNKPYLIGSVTKVFTAVAIMQLCEQGKIDIDKPVSDYVPDFKIKQRFPGSLPITVRSVLTHHAGIPSDIYLHKFSAERHDFNEILPYLNSQYTCFPTGKLWAYSNLGYALLGILIERVSGMKYEDYISKFIFQPLGMKNSGFYTDFKSQKKLSVAYNDSGKQTTEYPIFDQPAGSIYSTLNDMAAFCRSFIDKKEIILKNNTICKIFELQNAENLTDLDHRCAICFNFRNKAYETGRVFEHGGATMYHRAQIFIAPDAGLAAVVLSDSPKGKDNAWKLNEQLMTAYCRAIGWKANDKVNPEKKMQFTPVESKNLETYAGDYALPGMICRINWKNNYLNPVINGQSFYLVRNDKNSFVPAKRFMGIMFKSKKMHFLLEEINGEKLFIQAMPWGELAVIGTQTNLKPIPEIWKRRTGAYKVTNAAATDVETLVNVRIEQENGIIVLKYGFNPEMSFGQDAVLALGISNDFEAFVIGNGRGGGESILFDKDGKKFSYFGLQFSKI